MGFLAGATDVQVAGTESREFDGVTLTYTRYTFTLNGTSLGNYLISQTDRSEEKYGPIPAGMELKAPEIYQRMTGEGEIWLNEAGLPAHLRLTMDVPDQPKEGERATAVITTDYSRFDLAQLTQATTPFISDPVSWLTYHLPQAQTAIQTQLPFLYASLFICLLGAISLRYWQDRRFYAIVDFSHRCYALSPHTARAVCPRFCGTGDG